MLSIKQFTFNPLQENTYIIYDNDSSKECIIIDPGNSTHSEDTILFDFIKNEKLVPSKIVCTHAHIDHVIGIDAIISKYRCIELCMHQIDVETYQRQKNIAHLYGFSYLPIHDVNHYLTEQSTLYIDDSKLEILFTPGHAPGHICIYNKKVKMLISGDVLFKNSIGRSDLPGGNYDVLIHSIKTKLLNLPNDTLVYSGHGPNTNIGEEKMYNPFLLN